MLAKVLLDIKLMLDIERVLAEELDLEIPRKRRPVHDQILKISMRLALSVPPSEYSGAFAFAVSEWWSNFTPATIFRRSRHCFGYSNGFPPVTG